MDELITWFHNHWIFSFYRSDVYWWPDVDSCPMSIFGVAESEDGEEFAFSMDIYEDGTIRDVNYWTNLGETADGPDLSGIRINPNFKY